MKKVQRRALSVLAIISVLLIGICVFTFKFFREGSKWVAFTANRHIYTTNGVLIGGSIYDNSDNILVDTDDGKRTYCEDETIRKATMHIVGDKNNSVSTSILKVYADELVGYNTINGTYSINGSGKKIYTTLDPDVCATAYKLLEGQKGTVGVLNYKTGELICVVSTPTYDPAAKNTIDTSDPANEGIYINRLLSSKFTPGSVYKLVTAAAAIDTVDGIFDKTFTCNGSVVINGNTIKCSGTHGKQNFGTALKNSCNVAFGEIAVMVGWENMTKYAEQTGITQSHSLNDIRVIKGNIASSGDKNELAWTGIGQHKDEVNPLAMLRYMGAIANNGQIREPYVIRKMTTSGGINTDFKSNDDTVRILSEETANTLADMMRYNVEKGYGDKNYPEGMEFCAKTGTAELDGDKKSHAWFVGFCKNEKYPYAFVVMVQNGGSGKRVAGPIAAEVMRTVKNKVDNGSL